MNDLISKLEALLFIYGEPIAVKKAAVILGMKSEEIKAAAEALAKELKESKRGLALIHHADELQLVTRPDLSGLLEKVVKAEMNEALTPAAVETLSIVAYGAPISRAEIDYIRGVNSSFILRSLLIRGLITRENDPHRGNAYIYQPSFELLKFLGISKVEDLPEYEKFRALAHKISAPPTPTSVESGQAPTSVEFPTSNESGQAGQAPPTGTDPADSKAATDQSDQSPTTMSGQADKTDRAEGDDLVDSPFETEPDL